MAAWLLGAALLPLPAAATLGERLDSLQTDQLRLGATRLPAGLMVTQSLTEVHTLRLADGSTIRQFVNSDGVVYAIAWNTRAKPRLDLLLGRFFTTFEEAGREQQQQRAGVLHAARLQRGDLRVQATAHLNAHVGQAWLQSLLPAGTTPDALR